MKKSRGNFLIILGFVFLAGAVALCAYNLYEAKKAEEASLIARSALEEQIVISEPKENIFENITEAEIPDYILNPEMDMPVLSVEGTDYIGVLEVPSLGIKLPIISEWSYPNLKKAPCRYFGSAYLENLVIAGHNYSSHFSGIENLSLGEKVIFTDTDGNVFEYIVGATEVLPPLAIEEMTAGEWDLTLFTCNVTGSYRIAVRCDKTE